MTPRTFARRTLLRAAGGLLLGLPFLQSQNARAAEFPKRLLVIYTPNGNWELPTGMDFTGSMIEALTPFKQKLLLLRGLDMSVHNTGPGEPHQQGMAWLTGLPLNPGNQVGGCGTLTSGWASGISVDQAVANAIGTTTTRRSLHFGVQTLNYGGKEVRTVMSYEGSDLPVSNEDSPWNMYDTVFSQLGADPVGLEKLRARRHSILDAVDGQLTALAPKLGSDDKKKLELHSDSIRKLELQLDNPGAVLGGSCQLPVVGSPIELGYPENYEAIGRLQMDMVAMAFACDITRVATLQWSASTNNRPYPFLLYNGSPIVDDEHILGHQPDEDVAAWGKLRVIRMWYAQQLAYLLGKLDEVPEGEGTMLDNTLVVLGSELSRGNSHSHMDAPFILAGGAGVLGMNRNLDFSSGGDISHNNLLVAILNAMGVAATEFGDPAYCNRPLTELWG
jgi:uncharacterized protein DUF1552